MPPRPPQIPSAQITDPNNPFYPANALGNTYCLIKSYLVPNIKNAEVLNHGKSGPLNVYLFKLTL